ncbi:polysaccharide deacetylase family protein [Solibacillus sp. R5-41]|uniref:polysaccharide deacetylase family protein n=1 Tax=Solibacillus sp. R5-41 TaxID=2048654 RepID=UPI000C1263A4|nr:polysaccharide deacetylase family protein [Solibacillus sp. R5-41]ATP42118.1 polysaccharide deacetylase family protein [Solibacillus sp. R5-41]
MKKIILGLGAFGSVACYTVLPTIFIRTFSKRIVKTTSQNGLLLTFDDGPNPQYTPLLLDLLKTYKINAVFFVVAKKALQHPELIRRMQAEGHVIGIHHYTHQSSFFMTPAMQIKQLFKSKQILESITNEHVSLYRPPWGHFNAATLKNANNFQIMMWTSIFGDWKVQTCKTSLLQQLHQARCDGAIYVLHDCGQTFGADQDAPAHMLQTLHHFLEQAMQEGQAFTNPHDWKRQYVHS